MVQTIHDELKEASRSINYEITRRERRGQSWVLGVTGRAPLDESMEGMTVKWLGSSPGRAEVLTILPEDEALALSHANASPNQSGASKAH